MTTSWYLLWQLARRFRKGRQRNQFISFISASSTIGIALGCMVFITGFSVMNGFEKVLQERFLSLIPHVEFTAVQQQLRDPDRIIEQSLAHPNVVSARAVIRTQAMVQQGTQFTGIQVNGIDVEQPQAIKEYMDDATWKKLVATPNGVVLGVKLAQQLKLSVGDQFITLVARNSDFREPQRIRLQLVGTFEFGGQVDHQLAYVTLATARNMVGLSDGVTAIELTLNDIMAAQQVAVSIGQQVADYIYLDHWMRAQGHLYQDIQLVRLVMYLVLVLVLAVACFNIISTLVMTVQEKQRHIGILRTIGLRARHIMLVFVLQGLQNGVVGILIGCLAGVLLTWGLPDLMGLIQWLSGEPLLTSDVYFIEQIPVQLQWRDVIMVAAVAFVLSFAATLYPAWRAGRIEIVEAIND